MDDKRCVVCLAPAPASSFRMCRRCDREWMDDDGDPAGSYDLWYKHMLASPDIQRRRRINRLKHG